MAYFALNTIVLLLVAYGVGCIVGCWLRGVTSRDTVAAAGSGTRPVEALASVATPDAVAAVEPAVTEVPAEEHHTRSEPPVEELAESEPPTRDRAVDEPVDEHAAREPEVEELVASEPQPAGGRSADTVPAEGEADDLKRIKGVGPVIERKLNGRGVRHFRQIAQWTREDVEDIDKDLKFRGRIDREDWIGQAKLLAEGAETEFSKRVDKGRVVTSKSGR